MLPIHIMSRIDLRYMSEEFGSSSSVKVLEWLTQYKRLSVRPPESLSDSELKTLKELEAKLAKILNHKANAISSSSVSSSSVNSANERRRQQFRVASNEAIHYNSVGDFKKAFIKNISGGGVFIETDEIAPMGSRLTIQVLLPGESEPFSIPAEVAWTNPRKNTATPEGFGVKFVELTETQRQKIQKLIHVNLEKELKTKSDKKDKKP